MGAPTEARDYKLISADGHVMEPPDMWVTRAPSKYKDRVPRMERFEKGDAWIVPGREPTGFNWATCAGRRPDEMGIWANFEDISPGCYDAKARVADLDLDGVDAEVLFPNGSIDFAFNDPDPEYHLTMVQIYNDWLSDFCAVAPDRFGGCALLPAIGPEAAIKEIERLAGRSGLVAWLLKTYPHDDSVISDVDDPVWAAVEQSGKPITIHVSLRQTSSFNLAPTALPGTVHFYDAPSRMLEFIFSGVLDRFPSMQVFLAEVDCGWMPYFAQQADDNYRRHAHSELRHIKLPRRPSEYMKERFPASYVTDAYAIDNRHAIGVERMLWSSDYPHITSDWPYSWKTINAAFADVPDDERYAILAGNAIRLFGFGTSN